MNPDQQPHHAPQPAYTNHEASNYNQPPPPQPHFQDQPPPQPQAHVNSPGVVIMQWLTYAFWGWTLVALSTLTGVILSSYITNTDTDSFASYALAAVIVLLPISFITDFFYSKHEPAKKTGAAMVVMVIHAVIFALFGIGSLIAGVFFIVRLITSSSDHSGTFVGLWTALLVTVYYAVTFVRALNPTAFPITRKAFKAFMVAVSLILIFIAILGPVAKEHNRKNDDLVDSAIPGISSNITDYVSNNKGLPTSLSQLPAADSDTKTAISKNLIAYTPNSKPKSNSLNPDYYYTLCVTYKEPSSGYIASTSNFKTVNSNYSQDPDVYSHPAGYVCYKLYTMSYNNYLYNNSSQD